MSQEKKIVILFTIPDFSGGGAERVFLNLINNLNRNNYHVHVLVGKFQGNYCKELTNDVFLHELGTTRLLKSLMPMIKIIWKIKPDIILATLGYVVTASFASLFSFKNSFVISRFGNTISSFLEEKKKQGSVNYLLQFLINKSVFYFSDVIIVQSNHMRKDLNECFKLREKYLKKIVQINNPIQFDILNKSKNTNDFSEFFNNNFVYISVGRLDYRKNYEDLIRAFRKVVIDSPNARLMIIGEGEYRPKLEQIICELQLQNFIKLPGFISHPESLVSRSNFYVSSSLYEGVSNSILESLALGIPVIATNCPSGVSEIITEGENGYLVSMSGNIVNNLAEKMSYGYENIDEMNSNKISSMIKNNFDIKVVLEKYEIMISKLLKK
jgi:glycosyltransferase involved in cell wall biosynthesis